jgi:hypothetical protein
VKSTGYTLRARSGGWNAHPDAHAPDYRLLRFDMSASRGGERLGGNNVQVVLGAPDQKRYRLDLDVALWLESGWWVTLRNQFAQATGVGVAIVESVATELSAITAEATSARGPETESLNKRLWAMSFGAHGPDYWR